jgi:hypothetical protein
MSHLVADREEQKTRLDSIMGAFREVSVREKNAKVTFEQHINKILDSILDAKNFLQSNADGISEFLPRIEEVTWFTDVDEELLVEVNELTIALENLNKAMVKNYASHSRFFSKHNVDKKELRSYKAVADDVAELAGDLRAIFFALPEDQEFQELNEALNAAFHD